MSPVFIVGAFFAVSLGITGAIGYRLGQKRRRITDFLNGYLRGQRKRRGEITNAYDEGHDAGLLDGYEHGWDSHSVMWNALTPTTPRIAEFSRN